MPNGLRFPSNGESPASSAVLIRFQEPQNNGLPIWGPSNAGVTVVWRVRYRKHTGYYVCWWYGPYSNFFWNGGSPGSYYGCHPYPVSGGGAGVYHHFEIGIEGGDTTNTLAGSPQRLVYDRWYTQGVRVTYNGDNTKTVEYYLDLPNVDDANVISHTAATSYGTSYPSDASFYFGDSGWTGPGNERMSGTLGPVKIIAKVLSETDMLAEAANPNDMVTADGESNIWWGKTTFDDVDDLTCDFGTGRAFSWQDTGNKGSVETILRPIMMG